MNLHSSLKHTFGFDEFRGGQEQTITQLLAGQSSLAIFPTGSGKSLCYQLTAMHLPNVTLVVSPLLALMKDQLEFLASKGIAAASIDSTLTGPESQEVMADVRSGKIKILMVSVERFKNERFRQFIGAVPISMLVVDEAHCISEWGHNFRPDYLKLPVYCHELNIPLVLLLTATATKAVKRDMAAKFSIKPEHIIQTGFYRANLDLAVMAVAERDKPQQLAQIIHQQRIIFNANLANNESQKGCAGIVYVTLQHTAELVAAKLQAQGIQASAYHAGFDSEKRQFIQNSFMRGDVQIVVATIAFGMGIDKSDIRFVVHYDLPKSIENYSQEIGRAGRDGQPSNCITLANLDGLNTVENFVYGDTPEYSAIDYLLENIRTEQNSGASNEQNKGEWELQVISLSNTSNIRQLPLKTLLVQLEILGIIKPMYAYFAEFRFKFLQPKEQILAHFTGDKHNERRAFLHAIFDTSQLKKVWATPDFEALFNRFQYDRGRAVVALDYLAEKQLIELESKKMTEVFQVNQHELSNPNLAQQLYDYFIDKEEKEIKRIAALVRFFELTNCFSSNLARYFDDQNAPQQCGHCSVCRGQPVKLSYSEQPVWPENEYLTRCLSGFNNQLVSKVTVSIDLQCRFLAGISVPIFARNKVRQLEGFGCCEKLRYSDIKNKIQTELSV